MIKELFNKAVGMHPGDIMMIPCHDKGQQDSLRVNLSRQRKKLLEQKPAFDIIVRNETNAKGLFVTLKKVARLTEYAIITDSGVETHNLDSLEEDPMVPSLPSAEDRRKELMKRDGLEPEEEE